MYLREAESEFREEVSQGRSMPPEGGGKLSFVRPLPQQQKRTQGCSQEPQDIPQSPFFFLRDSADLNSTLQRNLQLTRASVHPETLAGGTVLPGQGLDMSHCEPQAPQWQNGGTGQYMTSSNVPGFCQ